MFVYLLFCSLFLSGQRHATSPELTQRGSIQNKRKTHSIAIKVKPTPEVTQILSLDPVHPTLSWKEGDFNIRAKEDQTIQMQTQNLSYLSQYESIKMHFGRSIFVCAWTELGSYT